MENGTHDGIASGTNPEPVAVTNDSVKSGPVDAGSYILRGRCFSAAEISQIQEIVKDRYEQGRTSISIEVCETLDWRQPNGWLKDRACRDVLRRLESLGLVALPEPRNAEHAKPYTKWAHPQAEGTPPLPEITRTNKRLELVLAKGNREEREWNRLVQLYHYLGHRVSVGKCLKFLVVSGDTIVSAVSLAETAWAVKDRDLALRHIECPPAIVANNNRFLILPNVKVPNLASRVLSLLCLKGVEEWHAYYSIELGCLETYVDSHRFTGASYKASNWINVGITRGYRKVGGAHLNSQTPKHVFLYPLNHAKRVELRRFATSYRPSDGSKDQRGTRLET